MLTMCDYYGMCDEQGRCVGHPVKVTEEYGSILKELGEKIRLVCSPCIANNLIECDGLFTEVNRLPYDISIVGNSIGKRISDKIKLFRNIRTALKNRGTIFFYQVDFFFFLYLKLFYKRSPERKIVILIYHQDFTGGKLSGILDRTFKSALHKTDAVIYTQKGMRVSHNNAVWMPDFIYRPEEYDKYRTVTKSNMAVCLGTMNRYKQIEQLIAVWRSLLEADIELIIAGRFDDSDRYRKLREDLPQNVSIRDDVLSYEEYMGLLSKAKYCILPYDMEQYKNRTSGVLLESIYCGVIPVAPNQLLKQNMLPGLGYECITEIVDLLKSDPERVVSQFNSIYGEYCMEYASGVLKDTLI